MPTQKGYLIINDVWNASPVSIQASIETVSNLDGFNKKILDLGDMLELGYQENEKKNLFLNVAAYKKKMMSYLLRDHVV
nr:cyanophycin synthetase [Bacillus sp. FJAT-28004]